jgi:hypothetical protein
VSGLRLSPVELGRSSVAKSVDRRGQKGATWT